MILYQFNTLCNYLSLLDGINSFALNRMVVSDRLETKVITDLIIDSLEIYTTGEIRRKYDTLPV